jgi:aryl-alcohol dehydrogenase-like predicted oxidoreductase
VPRDEVEIFTKVYGPMGDGPNQVGLTRKHIREGIDASLRRLGLDYVDLYQAHRYDHETPLEETMQAFADVVRAGKALYIGVSEWRAEEIRSARALADELAVPLISNQPQYSALYRVVEAEVSAGLPGARPEPDRLVPAGPGRPDRQVRARSGPARRLAGHGRGRRRCRVHPALAEPEVLERVQELRPLADEAGLSMAALALAWVLQEENVASAIIGASRPEQVRDNVTAAGVSLPEDLKRRIDELLEPVAETDPALTTSPNPRG